MMATAPTIHSPADVPDTLPDTQFDDSGHQDVDAGLLSVNGTVPHEEDESKRVLSIDDQANSAEASVNGGSDTEASRTGQKGHLRSASSVKKPATFKAVSVNKTFLASKASPSHGVAKPIDKPRVGTGTPPPGSSSLAASKPRLVAKTGAQGSGARSSSLANGGKPASAPDPNVVWNKNRPTPVPDPKKMTDEDLKKYGIHMASRLEEDETQGQSKWADLDDDDDDWAPEAITWTDGTKTTLPHPDEVPSQPPVVITPNIPKDLTTEKPKSPAPPPTSTSSPIPKPAGLPSGRGLKLKSTPHDKPTLVAKPITTQPAKSPWATLPPVDRASPVAIEPANPMSRGPVRENLSQKAVPPAASMPPPPPKEFAPDDFNRSAGWRDGVSSAGRELFNSQSGRYEPAFERRGSIRPEQAKQPHLLQRPSQADHPEPSSAFQTHRTSHDGHFGGRRRASSNVSGGSGAYYRSMKGSDGQVPHADHSELRRPSLAGSVESTASPSTVPAVMHGQARYQPGQPGWEAHASPQAQFAHPAPTGPPGSNIVQRPPQLQDQPNADEIEYQKKLMRERNEIARKRRMEQEAAEEAARRERIQKKLEAMGPAPKKKSDKVEIPAPEPARPTHIQQRDEGNAASQSNESAGQARKEIPTAESAAPATAYDLGAGDSKSGGDPASSTRRMSQGQDSKPGSWNGNGQRPERFNWPAVPNRNVWGSPNNDRGLGNGTFNPDLVRVPGSTANSTGKGPSPIAPPNTARSPPTTPAAPHQPAPIGSRARYGQQPDLANQWVSAVRDGDKKISAARLSERMERDQQLTERGISIDDIQPAIKDTWRPVNVPGDGTRRQMPPAESNSNQPARWQAPGDELPNANSKDAPPAPHPGVIGSGSNAILQPKQGTPSQPRTSRFFPSRDVRIENQSLPILSRPQSPSPPPPTMEDHPAYEGNVKHPHVSLPRPQPVVKLPPVIAPPTANQQRVNGHTSSPAFKDASRPVSQPHTTARRASEVSEKNWQQRFDNLFHNAKHSPPKAMVVDPASRNVLDEAIQRDTATVSLPVVSLTSVFSLISEAISKPMAEECFDEPEIGSLPHVRVPHQVPEALWEPVSLHMKPLSKRLAVHASAVEPFWPFEATGNIIQYRFPGMDQAKTITLPVAASRGGRNSKSSGRSRGNRGGNQTETSRTREPKEANSTRGRGNGRGTYRSRGSDNWNRSSAAQQPLPA